MLRNSETKQNWKKKKELYTFEEVFFSFLSIWVQYQWTNMNTPVERAKYTALGKKYSLRPSVLISTKKDVCTEKDL